MSNSALADYIKAARHKGHKDQQIEVDLVAAGWDRSVVHAAVNPDDDLPVPPPPSDGGNPRAVVQALSTRGLEFIIMFIALGVSAIALGSLLHSSVNALFSSNDSILSSGGVVPFAAAALIVAFPIFGYLFLRLKAAEVSEPDLRKDPSRKKAIQLILIVTFIIGLGNVIYFLYSLMSNSGANDYNAFGTSAATSVTGNFVHLVITLAITGGIFFYYWRDMHAND